jgi:hypothetical protein
MGAASRKAEFMTIHQDYVALARGLRNRRCPAGLEV